MEWKKRKLLFRICCLGFRVQGLGQFRFKIVVEGSKERVGGLYGRFEGLL